MLFPDWLQLNVAHWSVIRDRAILRPRRTMSAMPPIDIPSLHPMRVDAAGAL
jgi:hypothetical protein